ncbi:lysine-specific demethylase 5B-B-like [Sinocyclocheilus rhinocerous]|uniref:lysine-specific demethylase 5B-B-like n=1 Tax=Sinocyclocheilus rhinocerous TaxID=307959 RepID=UPI0007BA1A91|nr:PREDICTED: lysine-specific demethylase 5B-B-like [Sinocyclocheilus rhinocerous]
MEFGTTTEEMAQERTALALEILEASVFDAENNCSMCSRREPPSPEPSITGWIRCDSCNRWFHALCVEMDTTQLEHAQNAPWDCCLCKA